MGQSTVDISKSLKKQIQTFDAEPGTFFEHYNVHEKNGTFTSMIKAVGPE